MDLDAYFRHLDEQESTAKRLAFEEADDAIDSHVPALAIAAGIIGLIALLAAVQHLENLL